MLKNINVFGNNTIDFLAGMYLLNLSASILSGNYNIGTLLTRGGLGTSRFNYIIFSLEAIKVRAKIYSTLV